MAWSWGDDEEETAVSSRQQSTLKDRQQGGGINPSPAVRMHDDVGGEFLLLGVLGERLFLFFSFFPFCSSAGHHPGWLSASIMNGVR